MPNSLVAKIIKSVTDARKKAFEKTLPKGKTYDQAYAEEMEKLKKYLRFLEDYFTAIFETEHIIKSTISHIENKTNQELKKEYLFKELLTLRVASLHYWFFSIKPPRDQNEITENTKLIDHAFQVISSVFGKSEYSSWLAENLIEYADFEQLKFKEIKKSKELFIEKIAQKLPLIAFESTGGRLAGEQYDDVITLLQTTIENDKKSFYE